MRLKALTTLAVLSVAACSSQPTQPPASAAAAPAPAASPNLTAPAAPAAAADPSNPNGPVLNRRLMAAGYRATTIKGETYYCRMEDVTDTNFKRRGCLNEAQLREEDRKTQEMQDRMIRQQASPSCMGPTCAGG